MSIIFKNAETYRAINCFIEPDVKYWESKGIKEDIKHAAEVCYGVESTKTPSDYYNMLLANKHISMFRHASHYYKIPLYFNNGILTIIANNPFFTQTMIDNELWFSINHQYLVDNADIEESIRQYEISFDECYYNHKAREICRFTFCCTTQIGTSRELNRVSPNNIAEQSTRYVYDNGKLCKPRWLENYNFYHNGKDRIIASNKNKIFDENNNNYQTGVNYINTCIKSFDTYKDIIKDGVPKECARGVLPLDTATKVVYTYSVKEWRHILDLRYYGTTGRPHPDAKFIASKIRDFLINLNYEFREL